MTKQQINQINNPRFLVLAPKKDVIYPPKHPKPKQPTLRQLILDLNKRIDNIENLVSKVIKLNNLKTE